MSDQENRPGLVRTTTWDDVGRHTFVPEHYEMSGTREQLAHIAAHPVAQMFTAHEGQLQVTAAPFIHTPSRAGDTVLLSGHMAGRNPQRAAVLAGAPVLLQFAAPGAYISPRWFRVGKTAPTWSYVTVQARGRLVPIDDMAEQMAVIDRTVALMEARTPPVPGEVAWVPDSLSTAQIERYRTMILAFHVEVEHMEGICRLNQEKHRADRESIIAGLERQRDAGGRHIAALMRTRLDEGE
ncbi:MAG: FMN-binding negative transcriptional regulator [Alphaproteobacteria bacterium]|nr:MAG: FMN-binding negative transcriptional regulator [Alphaproteobacteria bacterium]